MKLISTKDNKVLQVLAKLAEKKRTKLGTYRWTVCKCI